MKINQNNNFTNTNLQMTQKQEAGMQAMVEKKKKAMGLDKLISTKEPEPIILGDAIKGSIAGLSVTEVDKNYKSEYGYIYDLYAGNKASESFEDFTKTFDVLNNKYSLLKDKIMTDYQGEEQTKRLSSLDKDYKTAFNNKINTMERAVNMELKMQEHIHAISHVDKRVHTRAMGGVYDESILQGQLDELKARQEEYKKMFEVLREAFNKDEPKDYIRTLIESISGSLDEERKVSKNLVKNLNNGKVDEIESLISKKNKLFLEYSDKLYKTDEEKYSAYLDYSKKIEPMNSKLDELFENI